jgi:hypothetical protein
MGEPKDLGKESETVDNPTAETGEGLDNPEDQFRDYCQNHLEQIFDASIRGRSVRESSEHRPEIWVLEELAKQDFKIPNYQIGRIFLEELTQFSLEKIREGQADKLQPFVANLYDLYFSSSPNISNYGRFSERFRLVAKLISIPELRPLASGNSALELVNDLAFGSDELARDVSEHLLGLSVGEVIAVIQMVRSATAQGIGQGEFAFDGIDRMAMIVSQIRENYPSRLVKYSCDICLEQIAKLWNEDYSQNSREVESREEVALSEQILSRVRLDPPPPHPFVARVAQNTVVALDRNNQPTSYGKLDFETLKTAEPVISAQTISELEKMRTVSLSETSHFDTHNFLEFVRARVLAGMLGHEPDNSELADFLSQNFKFLSAKDFAELIRADEGVQTAREVASLERARIDQEVSDKNEEVSRHAVQFFSDWLEEMDGKGGSRLHNFDISKFRKYQEEGNLEGAFSVAHNMAGILASLSENLDGSQRVQDEDVARLTAYFQEVDRQHTENWRQAESSFQLKLSALEKLHEKDLSSSARLSTEVGKRLPKICTVLLERCQQTQAEPTQTVHLKRIEAVDLDKDVNPWGDRGKEYAYLRFLWTPAMIRKVNFELGEGVDITELNASSQVQLLRFLTSAPDEIFDQLRDVLGQNREFGKQILQTFLSCGEDHEYGNKIIEIAQTLGPQSRPVFEKYAEIVELVSDIEGFIQGNFSREFDQAEIRSATQGLLKRGRDILVMARQIADSPEEIAARLQDYNIILLTFSEALKAARRSGATIELEEIKNLVTERVSGTEVSENDRHEILAIAKSNWSKAPNPSAPEAGIVRSTMQHLLPEVERGIREGFSKSDNEFVIIKIQGKIVAFLRFDKVEGGTYFGSFNVDENARGANLGRMICQKFVDERAHQGRIFAHCSPMQDISSYYISGEGGFVSRGIDLNSAGTGEVGFDLVRDDNANSKYQFAGKPHEEIVQLESDPTRLPTGVVILKQDHLKPEEYQQFLRESQEQYAQGKVMTAFFRYPKDSMVKYAVFEPAAPSSQAG